MSTRQTNLVIDREYAKEHKEGFAINPEKVIEHKAGKIKNMEDLVDKYLSGLYMIVAIKHSVSMVDEQKYEYTMMVDVVKDALPEAPIYYDGNTKKGG